jgi:sec-independent protein translocase protein TatA
MYANIIGPDLLIVLGVVVLLFGGSQLPKLARSLGSARREFEQGVSSSDEATEAKEAKSSPPPSA